MPPAAPRQQKFPDSEITWVVDKAYSQFLSSVQGIDHVIELGFRKMLKLKQLKQYRERLSYLSDNEYDVLFDFQGTLKSWLIILKANAERKIGFDKVKKFFRL